MKSKKTLILIVAAPLLLILMRAPVILTSLIIACIIGYFIIKDSPPTARDIEELVNRSYTGQNTIDNYVKKAWKQSQSLARLRLTLEDVCLANYQTFSPVELRKLYKSADEQYSKNSTELFSKFQVIRATGQFTHEDIIYIEKTLIANDRIIQAVSKLISEATRSTAKKQDPSEAINDYINALHSLT